MRESADNQAWVMNAAAAFKRDEMTILAHHTRKFIISILPFNEQNDRTLRRVITYMICLQLGVIRLAYKHAPKPKHICFCFRVEELQSCQKARLLWYRMYSLEIR
jgi:hypothetical protein